MARKTLRERLSGFRQKILGGIGKAATAGYKSHPPYHVRAVRDLPLFSFLTIQTMLRDPTVQLGLLMRSAPLCAAEFAYQDGDTWVPGVRADNPDVGEFVHKQLKRIWTHEIDKVLRDQIWGWSAGEVTYRVVGGKVHVDEFLDRAAYDTRALLCRGKVAGVRFDQVPGSGSINLTFPKCWWSSFNAEGGSPYGVSILYGAYSPWWDKWQERGALDVRRLFMRKDSYGGVDMTYPDGTTTYPDGTQVANFEIARQIVEQIEAGGVTTRPYVPGSDGKNQWELTRATIPSSPNHILDYPDRLDVEILRGIGVPDDVLTSESGGAWAGKQVPQAAFYTGLQRWLNQVIRTITVQILEPLVLLNWGRAEEFEVTTKPLAQQMQEQQKPPQGGQTPQEPPAPLADYFGQPARMALAPEDEAQVADIAAGRIVGAAESIVKAARMAIRGRAQRMATARAPKGGISIAGKFYEGGEFIPTGAMKKATAAQRRKIEAANKKKPAKKSPQKVDRKGGGGGGGEGKAVAKKNDASRAARAKASAKLVDKSIQRYSEERNEPWFAKQVNGQSLPNGEPVDVVLPNPDAPTHGIELKTMVDNGNDKLTMDSYSQVRKILWEKETGATVHTIVIDDRNVYSADGNHKPESNRKYYYRRGVAGSARIVSLHEVNSIKELRRLMDMDEADLPPKAQRTDAKLRVGTWRPTRIDGRKAFKNSKTGQVFKAKK